MLPCNQLVEEQDYVGLNTTQNMAVNILRQNCTAKLQLLAVQYRLQMFP
jgi:hypothetical protein